MSARHPELVSGSQNTTLFSTVCAYSNVGFSSAEPNGFSATVVMTMSTRHPELVSGSHYIAHISILNF